MPALVYLHGFASGPGGNKGRHARAWAEAQGLPFLAPDLNLPTFETLTLTAQVEAVTALLATLGEPAVLAGSSLGGLVAAAVARTVPVRHLILLAPAFGFARRRLGGPRWAGYRRRGHIPIWHHARNAWTTLGPELLADLPAWRDDDTWQLPCPMDLLHGLRDASVPPAASEAFAARHPQAGLHLLDDDHGLLAPGTLALLDACLTRAFAPPSPRPR